MIRALVVANNFSVDDLDQTIVRIGCVAGFFADEPLADRGGGFTVTLSLTDKPTDVQDKITDALIALAASSGMTVRAKNILVPVFQRGA